MAQRIGKNLYNAVGSFAVQIPGTNKFGIDLAVIEKWYS